MLTDRKVAELEGDYAGAATATSRRTWPQVVTEFVTPIRERVRHYLDDPAELDRVLARGAARAREVAGPTLAAVHEKIGFLPPDRTR